MKEPKDNWMNRADDGKDWRTLIPRPIVPPCATCKNYTGGTLTCKAFPSRIPKDILLAKHSHREPYPGDNGILYEPNEEAADKK